MTDELSECFCSRPNCLILCDDNEQNSDGIYVEITKESFGFSKGDFGTAGIRSSRSCVHIWRRSQTYEQLTIGASPFQYQPDLHNVTVELMC
jgi:hypothetical protein